MCREFFPSWYPPHFMRGCCWGPWPWKEPTKEERLKWLKLYKENLEKERAEVEKEMERIQNE